MLENVKKINNSLLSPKASLNSRYTLYKQQHSSLDTVSSGGTNSKPMWTVFMIKKVDKFTYVLNSNPQIYWNYSYRLKTCFQSNLLCTILKEDQIFLFDLLPTTKIPLHTERIVITEQYIIEWLVIDCLIQNVRSLFTSNREALFLESLGTSWERTCS